MLVKQFENITEPTNQFRSHQKSSVNALEPYVFATPLVSGWQSLLSIGQHLTAEQEANTHYHATERENCNVYENLNGQHFEHLIQFCSKYQNAVNKFSYSKSSVSYSTFHKFFIPNPVSMHLKSQCFSNSSKIYRSVI